MAVQFLFEHLGTVSMIDGTSVSLPEDSLSVLLGLYNSTKPAAFAVPTERWEMTADNQNYLREIVVSSRRKSGVSKSLRELIANTGGVIWHSGSVLVYGNCNRGLYTATPTIAPAGHPALSEDHTKIEQQFCSHATLFLSFISPSVATKSDHSH
jgi:hypothetical protein